MPLPPANVTMISATAGPSTCTTCAGSNAPLATGAGLTTGIVTSGLGFGDGEVRLVPSGCVVQAASTKTLANNAATRTEVRLPICIPVIHPVEPSGIGPKGPRERFHRVDVVIVEVVVPDRQPH